jgi:hypothetical protein
MSRLAVIAIVLALAVGPDAAAICGAWCSEDANAAGRCDHGPSDSPLVAAGNCCDQFVQGSAALPLMAARINAPTASGVDAATTLLPPPGRSAGPGQSALGRRSSVDARPLTTVLRI